MSLPKVELSILWRRTRRRPAVSSFGSDWSCELTWVMNGEVNAENRPVCDPSQRVVPDRRVRRTNINVVSRSPPRFPIDTLSYSSASLR